MKRAWIISLGAAVILQAAFILFGGLLFPHRDEETARHVDVELIDPTMAAEKPKEPEKTEKTEELKTDDEKPPDVAEVMHQLELSEAAKNPPLEAASLADLEQALRGQGGAGDFGMGASLASGGSIGGVGKAGELDEKAEKALFEFADLDQKPRAIFRPAPVYPAEMRSQKVDGVVSVIFIVDATGKVLEERAEKSTHDAFMKPALDAVRQWKFEPASKGGQHVACRMRVSIRFQRS